MNTTWISSGGADAFSADHCENNVFMFCGVTYSCGSSSLPKSKWTFYGVFFSFHFSHHP